LGQNVSTRGVNIGSSIATNSIGDTSRVSAHVSAIRMQSISVSAVDFHLFFGNIRYQSSGSLVQSVNNNITVTERVTRNSSKDALQCHSRSPILVPIESSYTTSY